MSQELISLSPDLSRLRDEGYDLEIRAGHLVMKDVPYVNFRKEVCRGSLVSQLDLAGDVTARPSTHVAYFSGDHPCYANGAEIDKIKHQSETRQIDPTLSVHHSFSTKPTGGYSDYYEKMTTLVAIIESQAQVLEPNATARTFPVVESGPGESVFKYVDTASSRAGISLTTQRLALSKIAIVGLGGTGSYVLDLVAKTPVAEIHLFDGDRFLQHNAFRCPAAASVDDLREKLSKVEHFERLYSRMRHGVVSHPEHVSAANVAQLDGMQFVFLCLDNGGAKDLLVTKLQEQSVPFVDVGMGVTLVDGSLLGVLRVTTSSERKSDHVRSRIPFSDGDVNDDYNRNIQIADLNALNAALAVVKWKKLMGFYHDLSREHFAAYALDTNTLISEECA
jgi:hypothetical protein